MKLHRNRRYTIADLDTDGDVVLTLDDRNGGAVGVAIYRWWQLPWVWLRMAIESISIPMIMVARRYTICIYICWRDAR